MERVIIGLGSHKLSATIEVVDQDERLLGSGRFTTDQPGYAAMRAYASRHAGHADILREELDGAVGTDAESMAVQRHDPDFWTERREEIEAAARSAPSGYDEVHGTPERVYGGFRWHGSSHRPGRVWWRRR